MPKKPSFSRMRQREVSTIRCDFRTVFFFQISPHSSESSSSKLCAFESTNSWVHYVDRPTLHWIDDFDTLNIMGKYATTVNIIFLKIQKRMTNQLPTKSVHPLTKCRALFDPSFLVSWELFWSTVLHLNWVLIRRPRLTTRDQEEINTK